MVASRFRAHLALFIFLCRKVIFAALVCLVDAFMNLAIVFTCVLPFGIHYSCFAMPRSLLPDKFSWYIWQGYWIAKNFIHHNFNEEIAAKN